MDMMMSRRRRHSSTNNENFPCAQPDLVIVVCCWQRLFLHVLLACVGHSLAEPNGERLLQFLWLCPQSVQGRFLISQPPFTQSCTHARCLVHHSYKAVLTSDALFTIHTKLYSRQTPCSPFIQSCTHARCLVHHSHKAVLTPDALFTINTKLYSRQMPCSPFTQSCTQASDALFTIHTKLYSRHMPCSPFTQSCTHVRCLVHHSHKALLTCSIPFGTTIHTKLCSVEVPCSVQPFTQSCIHLRYPVHHHRQFTQRCIHLRYPVHHHNSHKDVFTCGILFSTTIHPKLCSLEATCSAPPFTQGCVHFPLP